MTTGSFYLFSASLIFALVSTRSLRAQSNTATGIEALFANTTGTDNTATGGRALFSNTTGSFNTASGSSALFFNTTGFDNTANGRSALFSNTTGFNNTASGRAALFSNTTGFFNTASGRSALAFNTTGSDNTAAGGGALFTNTTGSENTATGRSALSLNTTGTYNTASGVRALRANTTGLANTASGHSALLANTTGSLNAALGFGAGHSFNHTVSTFVGTATNASTDVFNSTALGYEATVTGSNQVRVGNAAITSIGGQVSWTSFSDGRYKKNLSEEVPGLSFITKLRPLTYTLDVEGIDDKVKRSKPQASGKSLDEGAKELSTVQPSAEQRKANYEKAKVKYTGFVAQEVEEAARKLNYDFSGVDAPKDKDGFYGLRYAEFVIPLVKSVQELNAENKELKEVNSKLQEQMNRLEDLVTRLINSQPVNSKGINNTPVSVTGAYLVQNAPNPFRGTTIIRYNLPQDVGSARVVITNAKGQLMKTVPINGRGNGQISLEAGILAAGVYTYSLWVGQKVADTKQMVLQK